MAVLGVLHAPMLLAYVGGLLRREHYQFFPVIWIALLVLVFRRSSSAMVWRWYHWPLLLLDGLLLVVGSWYRIPWLGFAGFCAGCLTVLAAGRDKLTGRSLWPLALLPLITLRPPLNIDAQMITRLQLATTQAASHILSRSGILHFRRGVVLELPDRVLFIDEACSGIHSLFTLLALAVLIALVHRRHWLVSLLLLVSGFIWALLLNVLRVVVVVLADYWWGVDLASGWPHDVLGYILVGVALLCLLSTDRLLWLLRARIPKPVDDEVEEGELNPLVRAFNWFFFPPSEVRLSVPESPRWRLQRWQGASLLVAGAVFVTAQLLSIQPRLQAMPPGVGAEHFAKETLAAEYESWKRGEYRLERRKPGNMWGEHSCRWDFSRGPCAAQVSLDYPFVGWHELSDCYTNTGWGVTSREMRRSDSLSAEWPLVVAVLQDHTGRYGIACYSDFDGEGRPVLPGRDELAARVTNRWQRATLRQGTYQVQAFSAGLTPPSDEDIELLVRLHCQTRRDLAQRFLSVINGP